ncbi:LOW QUALITY PROTEIN: relaxin receptor 2 [Rhynochetos jubatus]
MTVRSKAVQPPGSSSNVLDNHRSLTHNHIHFLPDEVFSECAKVKKIFLQQCIQTISRKAFFGLCKLQKLTVDYNPTVNISQQLFTGLMSLVFSMKNNSLETLPKKICTQKPLINWVDFEGNHIKALTNTTLLEGDALAVFYSTDIPQSVKAGKIFLPRRAEDLLLKHLSRKNIHLNTDNKLRTAKQSPYKFHLLLLCTPLQIHTSLTDEISSFEDPNNVLRVFVWVTACVTCLGNLVIRSPACLMGVLLFSGVFDVKYDRQYKKYAVLWMETLPYHTISWGSSPTEVSVLLLANLTLENYCLSDIGSRESDTRGCCQLICLTVFTDAICWISVFVIEILSLLQVKILDTVPSWVGLFILPIHNALNLILYTLTTSFFKEGLKQSLGSD